MNMKWMHLVIAWTLLLSIAAIANFAVGSDAIPANEVAVTANNNVGSESTPITEVAATANKTAGSESVSGNEKSMPELIAACQAAKSNFRPLADTDLKSVKTELVEAVARLDEKLKSAGVNGEDWRKFVLLDTLQKELKQEGAPNRERLNEVYQRYASGDEGLGLVWFVDVQSALRRLLMIGGSIDNPQTKTLYEQTLDKLAGYLQAYAAKPSTEDALGISESIRWLKNARQAPELIEAIQQKFRYPNLYADVSAEFVNAGLGDTVNETTDIRDCIMGTDIHGTGCTLGKTTSELFPDTEHAVVDMLLSATTNTQTVGYHGPVCIYSNGITHIGACKRIWVDEYGVFSYPAVSNAVTQNCIADIQANRKLVERIAWKKAGQQMGSAEYIAARHAEQRANSRVDSKAAESIDKANQDYNKKYRGPLVDHKLFPEKLQLNTEPTVLSVASMEIYNSGLAAPTPPPEATKTDMTLRVHESTINNFSLDALGGMTVHEDHFQKAVIDTLGYLPEKMKSDEDQEPWAITFARRQPIQVTFSENGFKIMIRGSEYFKGDNAYPAMDVTVVYKIEKTETGFKAVRQGDIQIFPPGRQQVGGKEQMIRRLLMKRFSKIFEPEILGEGFEFSGQWKKVGKMHPVQFECHDGWLTLAWKLPPPDEKAN
jgi:hypothetical protein